jgi:hypothetical protein
MACRVRDAEPRSVVVSDKTPVAIFEFLFWSSVFWGTVMAVAVQLFRVNVAAHRPTSSNDESPAGSELAAATAGYFAVTLLFFLPILPRLGTDLLGPPEDNMLFYWNFWWMAEKVLRGAGDLGWSRFIYYPEGSSLVYHTWSFYNLALATALRPLLGPVVTYNVVALHGFVLAGLGAYLFVRYATHDPLLSFVGGLIYSFSSFHVSQAQHHINIESIQFIPFFVLYFIKAMQLGRSSDVAVAGLFLLLNALCDWNYLLFGVWFILFGYVYLALRAHRLVLGTVLRRSALMIIGTVAVLSPWLFRMIEMRFMAASPRLDGHDRVVADVLGFVIPGRDHWLNGYEIVRNLNARFTGNPWETSVYLGIVAIAIVLLAGRAVLSVAAKYWLGCLAFALLAMGLKPHVLGEGLPILMPYRLIARLPFLSEARVPSRTIVYVSLFWSVVVALSLGHLVRNLGASRRRVAIGVVTALLIADLYPAAIETTQVELPPVYRTLRADGLAYGILELPIGWTDSERYMLNQTLHHIPIMNGAAARKYGTTLIDTIDEIDIDHQKRQLLEGSVKYIVIHKQSVESLSTPLDGYRREYVKLFEDNHQVLFQVY